MGKREMEVRKEKEEEVSIVDLNEEEESLNEDKLELFNTDYICEVCGTQMGSKVNLMEHYSSDHMNSALKHKFSDLNEYGICTICKFDAEEEDLLWVHIGTLHEKVNIVLKENGFRQVGDKGQASLEEYGCKSKKHLPLTSPKKKNMKPYTGSNMEEVKKLCNDSGDEHESIKAFLNETGTTGNNMYNVEENLYEKRR